MPKRAIPETQVRRRSCKHQFEALQFEIGQMRKHDSIQGYVITELSDAYWEANGLLDVARGTKVYHDRLAQLNAPDVVVIDASRRDVCSAEPLHLHRRAVRLRIGARIPDEREADGRRGRHRHDALGVLAASGGERRFRRSARPCERENDGGENEFA